MFPRSSRKQQDAPSQVAPDEDHFAEIIEALPGTPNPAQLPSGRLAVP